MAIIPVNQPNDDPFKTFHFGDVPIRVMQDEDGVALFVAADVCAALNLSNISQAVARLRENERRTITQNDVAGNPNRLVMVTESGLYRLIFRSEKDEAEALRQWVFDEVLPSLRKTGMYISKPMSPAEMLVAQAQALVDHERHLAQHDQEIAELKAHVGAQDEHYTVIGYCRLKGLPVPDRTHAQQIGKQCVALSNKYGYEVGKVNDPRWGWIKTYHESILAEVLQP